MIRVLLMLILISVTGGGFAAEPPPAPALADGWIRAAPPGAKVLAGYGRLANPGAQALVIVAADSPAFERVELHDMHMERDVMVMRQLDRVVVPAHSEFRFEAGAAHLMLIAPKQALKAGDRVALSLHTVDGVTIASTLEVKDAR